MRRTKYVFIGALCGIALCVTLGAVVESEHRFTGAPIDAAGVTGFDAGNGVHCAVGWRWVDDGHLKAVSYQYYKVSPPSDKDPVADISSPAKR